MAKTRTTSPHRTSSDDPNLDPSLIRLDHFIVATRDSGYKGTPSAVAELVDNSLQAGARQVHIWVRKDPSDPVHPLVLAVHDDGDGMDATTLRQALRFGGTSRFNDRSGTGRYGMGLPNSSLSQARRVSAYTWRRPGRVLMTHIDVDDIANRRMTVVPLPRPAELPDWCPPLVSKSGTLVVWSRCDRLENRRLSTLVDKLTRFLGRVFRYRLWAGLKLTINGQPVLPIDPLFLQKGANRIGGTPFGSIIDYELQSLAPTGSGRPRLGKITVQFSELPVDQWHQLSNSRKYELGIVDQPIVSIVRGDREIDRGWFFMGAKRRENYDDWWRCEVRFDPVLDEWFGITHTKQQVRPTQDLLGILANDLEAQARALNLRVRQAHQSLKARADAAPSERRAAERERLLAPLPPASDGDRRAFRAAVDEHPALKQWAAEPTASTTFAVLEGATDPDHFFHIVRDASHLAVIVNRSHPFYKRVYAALAESERPEDKGLKAHLELLLIAAARAEALAPTATGKKTLSEFRRNWSTVLATYLRG